MQRSKFDIVGADAGAGGMSISSGSGGASGMGASSSSSDASAMALSTGSSGAGSGSMFLAKSSSREWSAAASATASLKWASLWARNGRHPVVQACGRASWREETQYDVRELLLHGGHRALAGVDAGRVPEKDPRLSFFARVQHVVQCGRELQECRRDGPAVLRR